MTKKIVLLIISAVVLSFSFNDNTESDKGKSSRSAFYLKNYHSPQNTPVNFPKEQFTFCKEVMPSSEDHYKKVYDEVNKYLAYPHGLKNMLNRADYWMPKISKKLFQCDLPDDLKYIPL